MTIGASRESRFRQVVFGSLPDRVADHATCSVLLVRHHLPAHWSGDLGDQMKSWGERMGWTTSAQTIAMEKAARSAEPGRVEPGTGEAG